MAKFCGSCGAQMDDNAVVCGYCGASLAGATSGGFKYQDPEKAAKTKKLIKKVAVAAAAVIVLIIAISIASNFIGYKGAVTKFMSAYKNEDADALVEMSCSFLQEEYADELAESYQSRMDSDFDSFDYQLDSKYSIKYEIKNVTDLSERQIKNALENLYYYGVTEDDEDLVKEIKKVRVTITAKKGSKTAKTTKTLYLAKESDGWKLLSYEG